MRGRHRQPSAWQRLAAWLRQLRRHGRADVTYRAKTGRVLTDADIAVLADEAERGYDVSRLRSRNSRPE
jgi:hypothetical protein